MALLRSATTVAGMTMVSRVLGFVRDMLMASVVGTGMVADAFVVAFRFPNLFRRLFAEGAFNAAFVPLFARRLEGEGQGEAVRFAEEVLAALLSFLLLLSAIAMLAMPWIVYGLAPGFADNPEKMQLTSELTRIAFPYLTFMSLVALLGGILNSLHRFTAAAAAPILLNVVMIIVLAGVMLAGWGNSPETGRALVWGVCAAGLLQFLMLWIALSRAGISLRLRAVQVLELAEPMEGSNPFQATDGFTSQPDNPFGGDRSAIGKSIGIGEATVSGKIAPGEMTAVETQGKPIDWDTGDDVPF